MYIDICRNYRVIFSLNGRKGTLCDVFVRDLSQATTCGFSKRLLLSAWLEVMG